MQLCIWYGACLVRHFVADWWLVGNRMYSADAYVRSLPLLFTLASHWQVLQVWWHGDDLHGLVEVLDTPAGRLVKGLYCQGFMFGASSRGWSCTVPQEDYSVIGDDFQLFA